MPFLYHLKTTRCQNIWAYSENWLLGRNWGPQPSFPEEQIIQLSWRLVRPIDSFFSLSSSPLLKHNVIHVIKSSLDFIEWLSHMCKMLCQIYFNISFKSWFGGCSLTYWLYTVPTAYEIKFIHLPLTCKVLEFLKIINIANNRNELILV